MINAGILSVLVNDSNFADDSIGDISARLASGRKIQTYGDDVAIGVLSTQAEHKIGALQGYASALTDAFSMVNDALTPFDSIREQLELMLDHLDTVRNTPAGDSQRTVFQTAYAEYYANIDILASSVGDTSAQLINSADANFGDIDVNVGENASGIITKLTVTANSIRAADLGFTAAALGGTTDAQLDALRTELLTAITTLETHWAELGVAKATIERSLFQKQDEILFAQENLAEIIETDFEKDSALLAAAELQRDLANFLLSEMFNLKQRQVDQLLR